MSLAEYQLLNLVLKDKDYGIIEENCLTEEDFAQAHEEFIFLQDFYKKYKAVPDKEKFSSKFEKFDYWTVDQPIKSIVDDIREQTLFRRASSILQDSEGLFMQDANKGVEYLLAHLDELQPVYTVPYTDIMHDRTRLLEWKEKQRNIKGAYIPLPFKELEDILYGYQKGEELFLWLGK